MRYAFALLATLPCLVLAAPAPWNDHKDKAKDDHKDDDYHWSGDHKVDHDKGNDQKWETDSFPFEFTSTLIAWAGPDQVINNSQVAVPGLPGAWGTYKFGLNSETDTLCYNISVFIRGNYSSPAVTATHIHQANRGAAGPPRIAFPNPRPLAGQAAANPQDYEWRYSLGCLTGPFTTGVLNNDTDTGAGFTIAALEANPENFFADVHTSEFPAGTIRGQIYTR